MVKREAWVSAASTARIVDDFCRGVVDHGFPRFPQAVAQIDVLVVEEVRLIESAQFSVNVGAKEHEHSGDPIRLDRPPVHRIVRTRPACDKFAKNYTFGWEAPRAVLD
jgi:hypothetical protein